MVVGVARFVLALGLALPAAVVAETVIETAAGPMQITQVAGGLEEPWGIGFLPDTGFLITERGGVLKYFSMVGTEPMAVAGVPEVYVDGQGGLLDVMIPRDFATSREVWLSYAQPQGGDGAGTALGRGVLSADGARLEGFVTLFAAAPGGTGGRHFGSRIVEALDGTIFLTLGERGTGPLGMEAQDPMRAEGKVIHLNRDGSPATRLAGALPGVYSLGHRNPQGAALDGEGGLWVVEHGAQGGDELNRVREGGNYGWPVIAYGVDYDGAKIGEGQAKAGMEQPVVYWDPSIAPSGMVIHSGTGVADWRGDVFVGSLKFDYIAHLDADSGFAQAGISAPETGRVRDVAEAPDGSIWFLSVTNGAAYRLGPP